MTCFFSLRESAASSDVTLAFGSPAMESESTGSMSGEHAAATSAKATASPIDDTARVRENGLRFDVCPMCRADLTPTWRQRSAGQGIDMARFYLSDDFVVRLGFSKGEFSSLALNSRSNPGATSRR